MERGLCLNGVVYSSKSLINFIEIEYKQTLPTWKKEIYDFLRDWYAPTSHIELQTSGSTGTPKTIKVKKSRMVNSATATLKALNICKQGKALLILPATHIAGKMMIIRAIIGRLNLITVQPRLDWQLMNIPHQHYLLTAVVPAQLMSLMHSNETCHLDKIAHLLIGGSAPTKDLETWLAQAKNRVYITYGMTETLSHVALRQIQSQHYYALPDIEFTRGADGHLIINASKLCNGLLHTHDLVKLINPTTFIWLARLDFVINSGGIKVHPELLEAKLLIIMQPLQRRYMIIGLADETLGEMVTLLIEGQELDTSTENKLLDNCSQICMEYETPRQIKTIKHFIMTSSGKLNRIQTLLVIQK